MLSIVKEKDKEAKATEKFVLQPAPRMLAPEEPSNDKEGPWQGQIETLLL